MELIRSTDKQGSGHYDLTTRCFNCRAFAYSCCYRGEWGASGYICDGCIDLMDGAMSGKPERERGK